MTNEELKKTLLNVSYVNTDGVIVNDKIRVDPYVYPTVTWSGVSYDSVNSSDEHISRLLKEYTNAAIKNAVGPEPNETTNTKNKKENNEMSTITGKINNPVKNVLFLAPGYQYALTVIANQSKELDRKKIPYNASKDAKNLYISTDKVHVEIVYMDPVKWTPDLFQKRDAVFGKKELLDKACTAFLSYFITPKKTLSKYIYELHIDPHATTTVKPLETYIPEIKNAYFNDPVTVVLWEDGTKTIVECQEGDVYSPETGLALCIAKKALGNMPNFNNVFRKWIPEDMEPLNVVMEFSNGGLLDALKDSSFYERVKEGIQRAFAHDEV